ncbi:MAG: hypothetical protein A2X35_05925 [Elusimicrobia bacterium GWA2_61_42]|nr:MAG: hypothetical protein A2X35_05925 [Elusimicrobia bacterium GWA2_61_42]OGR80303.1 MAG: hypothetical protein A2X38_00950 [Elusimicrobia bacterium GWC2_61_25]
MMKKLSLIAAAMLCASSVSAAELSYLSAGSIKSLQIAVPAPVLETETAKCDHVSGEITQLHLLAQASKSQLFSFADTEAQFNEFKAMWQPILEKFGMKVTSAEYKDNFGVIKYESPDGRVVREFMGERMNYDALSAEAMKKEQHMLLESLEKSGLTPVAAFTIKHAAFRPTFNVYYLTKADENQDHETQLRQLKNGEDIDFDLLAGAVTLVEKDASFSMVYIGKLLGSKSKLAADEAGIAAKLADYKKFLAENKKEFIAAKTVKLDEPFTIGEHTYKYFVNIYFFQ